MSKLKTARTETSRTYTPTLLYFFFNLVTGPGRSLSLKLSTARVYDPTPTPYTQHTLLPKPNNTPFTLHPTPYNLLPTSCALHPAPCTLHPTPYTLHPTPFSLHPFPYSLHTTPCTTPSTLNPAPYSLHPTTHAPHDGGC